MRTAALVGLPPAQLDALSHALAAGPIELDLLQTLLAGGFAATPLALLLADELSARCVLPATLGPRQQAVWREVLLHALRLPATQWELQATQWRSDLAFDTAALHPLLKALRDAAYRPCGMSRAEWQARLQGMPMIDSQRCALEWQRQQLGARDTHSRHAWAQARLHALAPDADSAAVTRALRCMRRQEQRERGLLDPHVGLLALLECAAFSDAQPHACGQSERAVTTAPLVVAAVSTGATQALAGMLLEAAENTATLPGKAVAMPLQARTFAQAITRLLAMPVQLDDLCQWAANGARAVERVSNGTPHHSVVAAATQGYVSQDGWSVTVEHGDCNPTGLGDTASLQDAVGTTLLGPAPVGTALVSQGDCLPLRYTVPGIRMLQAQQIMHFIDRQLPPGAGSADLQRACASLFGTASPSTLAATPAPQSLRPVFPPAGDVGGYRARAGALTSPGVFAPPVATGAGMFPGADAQMVGELTGHVPLALLQGLLDNIRTASWWQTLPGHVARTPQGLRDALDDLFALAGEPLHGRPPRADALQRFLDSGHGTAFFAAVGRVPELAEWQRGEVRNGDDATRAYAFMRMLRQLLQRLHAGARSEPDRAALHFLAGIGRSAGELLGQYRDIPVDAHTGYFARLLLRLRPTGAEHPSNPEQAIDALRARHGASSSDACPKVAMADVRRWLVDGRPPLLTPAEFDSLSDASRCLAQIEVRLARVLGDAPSARRSTPADRRRWRELADEMVQGPFATRPWELGVAVYFHEVASLLRGWLAEGPERTPAPETQRMMERVRGMIEPLQQLYTALDLPVEDADRHYLADHAAFGHFHDAVDAGAPASGRTVARRLCQPGSASVRDGLAAWIAAQVSTRPLPDSSTLPALWNQIIHGPHALQQWLASDAGRAVMARNAGAAGTADQHWQERARALRDAVLSQLPTTLQARIPAMEDVPALFAQGNAPVLSLALELIQADASLLQQPGQAVWLAVALLPHDTAAHPARLPLAFPLGTAGASAPMEPDTLPALDALLTRFGLALLHGVDADATLTPADRWALMSRTQAFAEFGEVLLRGTDWATAAADASHSPPSHQLRVAQALLDHYVGQPQIERLRTRLAAPDSVNRPFVALAGELRTTLETVLPQASTSALDILQWLLAGELEQPALAVRGIPYWLGARSLQGAAFLHGVELLEALHPGASARAHFDDVCLLPSQLAQPGTHAGDKDEVNALWARTMLRPALRYAAAHGRLPDLRRLDAATPTQANAALDFLQDALEQQALHLGQLGAPAPRRLDIAARTLTSAGVDKALWTQRPSDLPAGYLDTHGIVPARTVWLETHVLQAALPAEAGMGLEQLFPLNALVTAEDTLQQLMMADAYVSTTGPTTRALFDAAFDDHRRRVETGLAGLIENLLEALPAEDVERLRSGTVTPLRVQWEGQDGYQGLLLRCEPVADAGDAPVVYFEVFPSAGVARRAWAPPGSGARADARAMLRGTLARQRQLERLPAVDELSLVAASPVASTSAGNALRQVAQAAAHHLWSPWLDKVRSDELAQETRLEKVWDKEKRLLDTMARFTVPFFDCGENIKDGDRSAGAIFGCITDVGFALIPAGQLLGSTVRILRTAGERTVMSLTADAGRALGTFGAEIAQQSGVFLLRDLGRGALWVGGRAWQQARAGAGWLGQVLRPSHALDAGAQELAHALVQDDGARRALLEGAEGKGVLAAGHVAADAPAPVFNADTRWFRFDPVSSTPYGPPLSDLSLVKPLPASLPAVRTPYGLRFNAGDGTRLVQRGPDQWEVWVGDQPYRLVADTDALQLREVHGREPGVLEPMEPGLCRSRRALDELPCAPPVRVRFVPDAVAPLPDAPTVAELGSHALGYREYRLHTVRPGDDPAADAPLEPQDADDEGAAGGDADAIAQPGPSPAHLMVHDGAVCHWGAPPPIVRPKQQPRLQPPRLTRLVPEEATALGVPDTVNYLPIVGGHHRSGATLGLPEIANEAGSALEEIAPEVELGPIAAGINDGRRLRGIVMTINGQRSVCVEADTGVFYEAPFAADRSADQPLHFVRLRDRATIADYLRRSEAFRFQRIRASAAQDRRNIAEMAFNYMRRTPGAGEDASMSRFESYDDYVRWCEQGGKPNTLETYADKVLSGQRQQETFILNGRKLITDWAPLQAQSQEKREVAAEILNALLPVSGRDAGWEPLTAERLADPEIGNALLHHLNGANLAFARVRTRAGDTVVYYAISGGKRAARLATKNAEAMEGEVRYVDARREMSGQPPDPTITSLPVLRHTGQMREILFDRELDAERLITSVLNRDFSTGDPLRHLDMADIASVEVFTLLDACASCGGVVLPQLRLNLPDGVLFSIHYLKEYA